MKYETERAEFVAHYQAIDTKPKQPMKTLASVLTLSVVIVATLALFGAIFGGVLITGLALSIVGATLSGKY
jgi:hypothetical protein